MNNSSSKIQQYSPSEPAKVYEKTIQRRSNALFNPKVTLQKLKEGAPPEYLDEEGRRDLIRQYLDVRLKYQAQIPVLLTIYFAV